MIYEDKMSKEEKPKGQRNTFVNKRGRTIITNLIISSVEWSKMILCCSHQMTI